MKILKLLIALLVIQVATNAQEPKRVLLLEEGKGTRCQWCPRGDVYLKNAQAQYSDNIALVSVHGYNSDDPMYYQDHINILTNLGMNGFPGGMLNRKDVLSLDIDNMQLELEPYINSLPLANVMVENNYNEESRELEVTISIYPFENLNGEYRIGGIVTEDAVTGPPPFYEQSNAFSGGDNGPMEWYDELPSPVPASLMMYNHVSRQILGADNGEPGSLPNEMLANQTYSYTFNYTIPENYNPEYIRVIGVLFDSNNEVINAGKSNYLGGNSNAKPFFHSEAETEGYTGLAYNYEIVAQDPEHEELSLSYVSGPDWLSFTNTGNGLGILEGVPVQAGVFEVILSVSDGNWVEDQIFTIQIEAPTSDWVQIGNETINANDNGRKIEMVMDSNGLPIIMARNYDNKSIEIYGFNGSEWEKFGENFTAIGLFDEVNLTISPEDIPYVSSCDIIYKYVNDVWVSIPGAPDDIEWTDIKFSSQGILYGIAHNTISDENFVYKYSDNTWEQIGSSLPDTYTLWPDIEITPDGNPIIIYCGGSGWPSNSRVVRFNGTDWDILGGGDICSGFTKWNNKLAVSPSGNIFAATVSGDNRTLNIFKYNGTNWDVIGDSIASGVNDFSMDIQCGFENDIFVVFNDINKNNGTSCYLYNGENWIAYGQTGFTQEAKNMTLQLDENQMPYVAYFDILLNSRVGVKKFVILDNAKEEILDKGKSALKIYPNPCNKELNIEYQNADYYQIYNSSGNIIYTKELNNIKDKIYTNKINVESYSAGIYYVKLFGENKQITKRFSVVR